MLIFGQVDSLSANTKTENKGNFVAGKIVQTGVADLKVTVRVIAVETAAIMSAPSASSEQSVVLSQRSTSSLPYGATASANAMPVYGYAWAEKPIDAAVEDVTAQLSQKISSSIASLQVAAAAPSIPKFVGMEDGLVVINKGQNAGIKVGDKFNIIRQKVTDLVDPDTNQPITRKMKLCTMVVTIVEDTISSGTCDSATPPQKGDEIAPAQ